MLLCAVIGKPRIERNHKKVGQLLLTLIKSDCKVLLTLIKTNYKVLFTLIKTDCKVFAPHRGNASHSG